ncbi:alpha-tectorin-like [Anolis sagrei]|uniref:alpha-tectorin-like n=1 Tax=Anolis sagrei TaxID=38937 RepID=UPI003522547A
MVQGKQGQHLLCALFGITALFGEVLTIALLLMWSSVAAATNDGSDKGDVMYPYGEAEGDQKTPKDDDGTSPEIHMSEPFKYFGVNHTTCFVNNNGVVSFDEPVSEYTPKAIPLTDGEAFVAPYWGDVNNKLGGDIWYRETKDPIMLDTITKDMNKHFPDMPFTAKWAFIATWDHVAYFGSRSNKTNTFQCVLTNGNNISMVMLNYGDIQWTTGTASGGDRKTGLGGTPAQAGFNTGDNENYYSIPGSRSAHILNIINTSNVEVPGRWAFRADNFSATGVSEELQKLIPTVAPEPEPEEEEEEPQTPEEEPQTPMEEPQTPEEEPQTPMEEPQTPEEEPQTPMEEPQTPMEEPQTTIEEPPAPVEEKPQTPEEEPQIPMEEPQTPIEEPQAPEEKPQTTVEEPSTPVEEPPASVEEEPEDPFVEEEPEDPLYDDDDDYYYDYDDEDCE